MKTMIIVDIYQTAVIEIIKLLVEGVFISATVIYLSKHIVDRFFVRDLEKFKAELEKDINRNKTQFEKLHIERAEIIKEIFFSFQDIKNTLFHFYNRIDGAYKGYNVMPPDNLHSDYDRVVVEIRRKIEKNAIFFNNDLVEKMKKITFELQHGLYAAHGASFKAVSDEEIKYKIEEAKNLRNIISGEVLKPLADEFRKILGIDLSDDKK